METYLVFTLKRIGNCDINLGSIECTMSWVELPRDSLAAEFIQGFRQHSFGSIPSLDLPKEGFGTGRKLQLEGETKLAVHGLEKVKESGDLLVDLS